MAAPAARRSFAHRPASSGTGLAASSPTKKAAADGLATRTLLPLWVGLPQQSKHIHIQKHAQIKH
eukprot:6578715-Heterocapsa_arctica.AAC.1